MPRLALGTRVWVVLIVCVLTEPTLRGAAAAQPAGNVAVDGFRPAIDARGLFTVNGAQSLGSGEVSFGLGALGWGHRPLALDGDGARYSIDEVVTATLIAAVGLRLGGARLELGASLPLSIMSGSRGEVTAAGADPQGDTRAFRLAGQGVGSAGLHLKVPLVRARGGGLGVAALASVYLPAFGARDRFLGEDQVVPQLTAVVDRAFGRARRLRLALNAGARLRKTTTFTNRDPGPEGAPVTGRTLTVSSELPLGLGAAYAVAPGRFELVGEVFGAIPLGAHEGYRPLEALAGIKVYLATSSFLSLGVGRRLGAEGGASADARAFLSIVFEPGAGDRDGDGIADGDDRCPDAPEDVDGFEDDDGCPDLDNDGDQVPDALDRCPDLPDDAGRDGDRDEIATEIATAQHATVAPAIRTAIATATTSSTSSTAARTRPRTSTASRTKMAAPTSTTTATASSTSTTCAPTRPRTSTASRTTTAAPTSTTIATGSRTPTTGAPTAPRPTTRSRTATAAPIAA